MRHRLDNHVLDTATRTLKAEAEARRAVVAIRQIGPGYGRTKFCRKPMWQRPADIAALAEGLRRAGLS